MRNENPIPIRCAICDCTGPPAKFSRPGETLQNWIEFNGRTYMVCNDHIDSVYVMEERALHGHPFVHYGPTFYSDPTLRDLERRIAALERQEQR